MTARPGWPADSGAATFQDIRRSLAGQVAKSAAGVLRTGILPIGTGPLMVGTASMVVNVQTCVVVLDRNGAVFLPNDGVQAVQLSSAPSSGSRWSVVYAKQRETEAPFSDTVAGPLIDKVESTTSETAARNLLPAGARELGVWKVDAGATTTNAATGVTYTETVPYTAMEGGVVLLRNQAEQDAWAPHNGSIAFRLDTGAVVQRIAGAWSPDGAGLPHFGYRKTSSFQWAATPADHTWDSTTFEGALAGFTTSDRVTFTCTVPGVYAIAGQLTSNTGSATTDINLVKNGAVFATVNGKADASSYMSHPFSATIRFNAGDTFKLQLAGSGVTSGIPGPQSFMTVDMLHA